MTRILFFLFVLLPVLVRAQFTYTVDQGITVQNNAGNALPLPWAGGLNAAQYNTMDLNDDGAEDLVLFDRMANKVITFLREENEYRYRPQYEVLFPGDISNWMLLRDHNCDGKKDLFTAETRGIKVYTNVTQPGSSLTWRHFTFFTGFSGPKSDVLLTQGFSNKVNLQLQYDDLPAIVDADGDGDLDIFNMRYPTANTVEFHQNLSQENYGRCDSLDFVRVTTTWGNFKECSCGSFAFNGQDCGASGGRTKHAGGKSLLALDLNQDAGPDLILSEAECGQLFQLINTGTLASPVISASSGFPASPPVNYPIFPAAYYEDVDFDGVKDLISSPNIYTKEFLSSNLSQSNWFYKNTGSSAAPVFNFVQKNFLQDQMIDVGDNAVPAFSDYDGDGDYDMFISRNFPPSIFLYENTGDAASPSFKLITDDFLAFTISRWYNLKIQFADMNSDNTPDLVWTATSLDNGVTRLYYMVNKSQNVLDFSGEVIVPIEFNLSYNENVYATDVDGDGLTDLLAGRGNGSLQYWRNTGSGYSLAAEEFLGLGSSVLRQNIRCAVADLDADGKADLMYGDQTGKIKIISDFHEADATTEVTQKIFNPLLPVENAYTEQNLGGRTWPVAVNLYNSNTPAIVAGNILGGVQVLRNDEGQALPAKPIIDIYPNPVATTRTLNIKVDRPAIVQLISPLGQQLNQEVRLQPQEIYRYKLPTLAPGLYFIQFTVNNKTVTERLIIH
jgi:hypothetical protein